LAGTVPAARRQFVVFWTSVFLLHKSTDRIGHYGDNAAYLDVANAILHWDFHDLQVQHFMGYPYLIAAVSLLFRVRQVWRSG
jgi:hypothetical protein